MIILRIIYFFDDPTEDDKLKKKQTASDKDEKLQQQTSNDNQQIETNRIINFDNKAIPGNQNKLPKKTLEINDYRQFVELFFKNREGMLHTMLYNEVALISFKEGEVVLNIDKISDKSFIRTITKLISTWTGRIWQIRSSSSNLGKSLYEEDLINQQKEIEIMKNNPDVKKILSEFPKSKIHSITDIGEMSFIEETTKQNIRKEK